MPPGGGRFHRRLRGCGYRLTVPRIKILEVLNSSKGHLSAEEIFFRVHKLYPGVGLTTVYRTLEMLSESGIVDKIDMGEGRARYEIKESPKDEPHLHLICRHCGRIINACLNEKLKKEIDKTKSKQKKENSFDVDNFQLRFYGICKNCK
jgi:Fur family ferric uptake transcriptional regulator